MLTLAQLENERDQVHIYLRHMFLKFSDTSANNNVSL